MEHGAMLSSPFLDIIFSYDKLMHMTYQVKIPIVIRIFYEKYYYFLISEIWPPLKLKAPQKLRTQLNIYLDT